MAKSKQSKSVKAAIAAISGINNAADLAKVLDAITKPVSVALASVTWGAMYRPISAGHVNKRGIFTAAIALTVQGDGALATLKSTMAGFSVPALRAELQYAVATGDAAYFKSRKGGWCDWALPLLTKDGTLDANATDANIATAFEATCPLNRANVNGMVTEITLAAERRNVTPLPVFADVVATGLVTGFVPDQHAAYASKGYGHATFAIKG